MQADTVAMTPESAGAAPALRDGFRRLLLVLRPASGEGNRMEWRRFGNLWRLL